MKCKKVSAYIECAMELERLEVLARIAVMAVLVVQPFSNGLRAQTKAAPKAGPQSCGKGVALRLSAPVALQGNLLRADLKSQAEIRELKGSWAGKPVPFWSDAKDRSLEHALLGVDLERAPGKYVLALTGKLPNEQQMNCSAEISVRAGKFAVEKLTVGNQFVDVNPQDQERAKKEGERLHEIYATATPEPLWRGKFQLPLDGAHAAKNFGKRRVLNGQPRSPHSGMDFPAEAGTPVHAAQRGKVVVAEELFFSGNTVVIDHGLGIYTFYGHLESVVVSAGDMVEAGAVIGKVGATGRATGPHLHWGLSVDTARVNPLQIVGQP